MHSYTQIYTHELYAEEVNVVKMVCINFGGEIQMSGIYLTILKMTTEQELYIN